MKVGDEIVCMHCGANSFLVKKSIMDGWTKVGEVLLCSSCAGMIYDLTAQEEEPEKTDNKPKEDCSLDSLSSFLGTEREEKPSLDSEDLEKHFCRDCKYFVHHPFLDRCSLHEKEINPMDDCKSFIIKK